MVHKNESTDQQNVLIFVTFLWNNPKIEEHLQKLWPKSAFTILCRSIGKKRKKHFFQNTANYLKNANNSKDLGGIELCMFVSA